MKGQNLLAAMLPAVYGVNVAVKLHVISFIKSHFTAIVTVITDGNLTARSYLNLNVMYILSNVVFCNRFHSSS